MRPSIDIPFKLHEAVKDFAEAEHLEISIAYGVLLKRGLENDGGEGR